MSLRVCIRSAKSPTEGGSNIAVKMAPSVDMLFEENMVRHDMEGSREAGSVEGCIPLYCAYAGASSSTGNAAD